MLPNLIIREYRDTDAENLAKLYFDAIHRGTSAHYSKAQRLAWAPDVPESQTWRARLESNTIVAALDGRIVGFLSTNDAQASGEDFRGDRFVMHIDLLFVSPDHGRMGIASRLLAKAEVSARDAGATMIEAFASDVARPCFEKAGFLVISSDLVDRHGVILHRSRMTKPLTQ